MWLLQAHPGRLLNDFTSIAGEGAALLNASVTAAIGLLLVRVNRVRLSGPTVAAVFTILGFGLFGKTPTNVLPILLGVFLSARLAGKKFNEYILIALFGTALAPLVTMLAVEITGTVAAGLALAAAGGVAAGLLLPPLAIIMLRLHQGFNLYNIGLTSGFLGLLAAGIVSASQGKPLDSSAQWNSHPSLLLVLAVPALCALLLGGALLLGWRGLGRKFLQIMRIAGRLPSDFMEMVGVPASLLNMAALGGAAWLYVMLVGGPLNGPVLGGILTLMGFASFGKHPRNVWPVVGGVIGATLLFGKGLASPGPLLAVLFGTTLAPLAGEFGPLGGLAAGFLHLVMVEQTAAWHLGINLYNNGFAGGLTATYFVAFIEWFRSNRAGRSPARRPGTKKEGGK